MKDLYTFFVRNKEGGIMEQEATFAKRRYIIITILIALILSSGMAYSYHLINPYQKVHNLEITVLSDTNKNSYGHNVRIWEIRKADGTTLDLENTAIQGGWTYGLDANILGYYQAGGETLSIPINSTSASLGIIKNEGSGIVELSFDGNYRKTIDLYDAEWQSGIEMVEGIPDIWGMVLTFIGSFLLTSFLLFRIFQKLYVKKEITRWDLLAGFSTIIAFSSLVCVYAPLELFFANSKEFWFDSLMVCLAAAHMFLLSSIILGLILSGILCVSSKIYRMFCRGLLAVVIVVYIQGTFLAKSLPSLDGTNIDWSQYIKYDIITAIVAVVVVCGIGAAAWKLSKEVLNKGTVIVTSFLCLMLMSTLIVLGFSEDAFMKKGNMKSTVHNEFVMSNNKNFIIFLLDAVDSHSFWNVLESTPEYKKIFEDFTYYPNTLGAYSFTSRAIPHILGGEWYENDIPFEEYQRKTLKESPLFKRLEEENYSIGIYDQDLNMPLDVGIERFENQEEISQKVTSWKEFLETYLCLGGVRYAPYKLKAYCYNTIGLRDSLLLKDPAGQEYFKWSNLDFYSQLLNHDLVAEQTDNAFKFIHLEGAHVPYQYDKNMNKIEGGTYDGNLEACITLMKTYLEALKNNGLYDNTAIIFMSDHGYWEDTYNPNKVKELRQNPLLMVKGFQEKHDFELSNAPISYEDLQLSYERLLNGMQGDEIFDAKEGESRMRRFLFYMYLEEETMEEYVQDGHVWEADTIHPTGTILKLK